MGIGETTPGMKVERLVQTLLPLQATEKMFQDLKESSARLMSSWQARVHPQDRNTTSSDRCSSRGWNSENYCIIYTREEIYLELLIRIRSRTGTNESWERKVLILREPDVSGQV